LPILVSVESEASGDREVRNDDGDGEQERAQSLSELDPPRQRGSVAEVMLVDDAQPGRVPVGAVQVGEEDAFGEPVGKPNRDEEAEDQSDRKDDGSSQAAEGEECARRRVGGAWALVVQWDVFTHVFWDFAGDVTLGRGREFTGVRPKQLKRVKWLALLNRVFRLNWLRQ
jgi:hypothetical protein